MQGLEEKNNQGELKRYAESIKTANPIKENGAHL
jgi:hypothetical protein